MSRTAGARLPKTFSKSSGSSGRCLSAVCVHKAGSRISPAIGTPNSRSMCLRLRSGFMGAPGISGWLPRPRATQDVNVLVQKSHHRKAWRAVAKAYPHLTVQDLPAVTRFLDPATDLPIIDLMKPEDNLYAESLKNTV